MRVRSLISALVWVGAFAPFLSRAEGGSASAPPGYAWCALEHLSGKVLIPAGWFCRGVAVHSGTGYEITKEEVVPRIAGDQAAATNKPVFLDMSRLSNASEYRTGFTVKVISGPFWNESRLSKLADGLVEDRKREGRMSTVLDRSIGTFKARSFNREGVETVGHVIETQHFVELILLDTKRPTLILLTFDCPLSDWPQNKDFCDKFFATLSLFQGNGQPNHSPYPTPESFTTGPGPQPREP